MNKKTIIALAVFAVFALLILAFVPPPVSITNQATPSRVLVYEGVTPCADCPGIVQRLTLSPSMMGGHEGAYELSLTYLDRDVSPFIETGTWTTERGTPTDPDATVIALHRDGADQPQRFRQVDATSIRMLDVDGNEIDSNLPFTLTRVDGGTSVALPGQRSVTGTQICLPHRDTSGPQTLECALGLRGTDGQNYALDLSSLDEASRPLIQTEGTVTVSGMFAPVEILADDYLAKYDIIGVISVASMTAE